MIPRKVITNAAHDVGFDLVGVIPVEALDREHAIFDRWLADGCQSTLGYMERNVDKRFDVSRLVEGSRSVVVCAVSYLSPYGRGYDVHLPIRRLLPRSRMPNALALGG